MLNLIPKPVSIVFNPGDFILSDSITLHAAPELQPLADYLSAQMGYFTGRKLNLSASGQDKGRISLSLNADESLGLEGYELAISADGIQLRANQPAGLFHAIQTLLQMIPAGSSSSLQLPAVSIQGYSPLRMARRDARCGASLFWRGGCQALTST